MLFYRYNSLYAVAITPGDGMFHADRPLELFQDVPAATLEGDYDVLSRTKFLLVEPADDEEAAPGVTVLVNWLDELRRRVPE